MTGIDPVCGPFMTEIPVTITGANFVAGATVRITDGIAEEPMTAVVVVSDTEITATTPSWLGGSPVDVIVQNPDMQEGTLEDGFAFPCP